VEAAAAVVAIVAVAAVAATVPSADRHQIFNGLSSKWILKILAIVVPLHPLFKKSTPENHKILIDRLLNCHLQCYSPDVRNIASSTKAETVAWRTKAVPSLSAPLA
jgi:hypothetical protein